MKTGVYFEKERFLLWMNRRAVLFLFLVVTLSSRAQERIPVTERPFNDDTSKLQFAIVSDLWGGYREGVFEDAVRKLELLQPQFVMSVGDLIEGKTYDSTVLNNEWKQFNAMASSLSLPFFYVPGNHDVFVACPVSDISPAGV